MPTVATEQPGSAAQLTPTNQDERPEILDVVPGFALLGVVVMNRDYAGVRDLLTSAQRHDLATAGFDRVVQMLDMLLVKDRFYTLFSILKRIPSWI